MAGAPATLFFDLDGTLIDSATGITRCVAHALTRMRLPVPDERVLRGWIGPSLRHSFSPLLNDPALVEQAVGHYLERFDQVGWSEHAVYRGIAEAVETLHARGHRLAVVTAKNEPHARRIVEHLPFGRHFEHVVGATAGGERSEKPELIAEALARMDLAADSCWMIGDRRMDIEGARHHRMRSIGALWGFGGEDELRKAGASRLAMAPEEVAGLLAHDVRR